MVGGGEGGAGFAGADAAAFAIGGLEGLRLAAQKPEAIVLDLGLPDLDGRTVLFELKQNPATKDIPVIINTSRDLSPPEKAELTSMAVGLLSKNETELETSRQALLGFLASAGVID